MHRGNWHVLCTSGIGPAGNDSIHFVATMDRIEILTRLNLILRRLERLADLETTSREDRSQTEEEITWLREKWQELTHELDRKRGLTDVPSEN